MKTLAILTATADAAAATTTTTTTNISGRTVVFRWNQSFNTNEYQRSSVGVKAAGT